MRRLTLLLSILLLCSTPAGAVPNVGSTLIDWAAGITETVATNIFGIRAIKATIQYSWSITREPDGTKAFTFSARRCDYFATIPLVFNLVAVVALPVPACRDLSESEAQELGPIIAAIAEFHAYHPKAYHRPLQYEPNLPPLPYPNIIESAAPKPGSGNPVDRSASVGTTFTALDPLPAVDPQIVFLDGFTDKLHAFDLTQEKIVSTVTVPSTVGPAGIRPVATGEEHEVWVANGGKQVTVADLTTQAVITNIATPSLPTAGAPAGIVFTPDGATAFEAVGFYSPDSSGNNGALVTFDAVHRTVKSTFPLKNSPNAILMAPDGYTLYLLFDNGDILYYDVLSGTGDLKLSTYTPGQAGGYPGFGSQAYIAPNGTELYWNVGYLIVTFDLTTHKISNVVNTGLPSTSSSTLRMSQDGSSLWLTNALGTVANYDPRTRSLMPSFTVPAGSDNFPGVAN